MNERKKKERKKSPEMTNIHGQMIFDKGVKIIQWRKESLSNE